MKKAALLLAAILLLMHPAAAACLVTGEDYGVGAAAAIVMEAESGEVLFAQEIHRQLPMASTTKIMTALLTLEQPNLQQEFTVDGRAIPSPCTRWRWACCWPAAMTPPGRPRYAFSAV